MMKSPSIAITTLLQFQTMNDEEPVMKEGWEGYRLPTDPRVLPIGRVLRDPTIL